LCETWQRTEQDIITHCAQMELVRRDGLDAHLVSHAAALRFCAAQGLRCGWSNAVQAGSGTAPNTISWVLPMAVSAFGLGEPTGAGRCGEAMPGPGQGAMVKAGPQIPQISARSRLRPGNSWPASSHCAPAGRRAGVGWPAPPADRGRGAGSHRARKAIALRLAEGARTIQPPEFGPRPAAGRAEPSSSHWCCRR
jgi:hypothetical protein